MQSDQNLPSVDKGSLTTCFHHLYSPQSSPQTRKQADQHLISLQKNPMGLLGCLLELFQQKSDKLLSFQALVYFANVVKRNWTTRRYNKEHSQFQIAKKAIRQKLLQLIFSTESVYTATLFDVLKFVVKIDYPQHYPQFSQLATEIARQISEAGPNVNDLSVSMMKQLRQIFIELGQRKGYISRKLFEQNVRMVLNSIGSISINFKTIIENNINSLSSNICKISKYSDQILVYLLKAAPVQMQDQEQTANIMNFLQQKLEFLITLHQASKAREVKILLQKNIKSLIYDQGVLSITKPLFMGFTLPRFYQVLFYIITNHSNFAKNGSVRYSLIGIRRIFKQFTYYSDDAIFGQSMKSKHLSPTGLALRKQCHSFYLNNITPTVIENLLNFLLQNPYARTAHSCLDLDQASIMEKGQEKELNIEECVVWLIQGIIQRFSDLTQQLIRGLVLNCLQSNWTNLDQNTISNLLSVVGLLPSSLKKSQRAQLSQFPILQILQFVFKTPAYKVKFAPIVGGWHQCFQGGQIVSMTQVLLSFMEQEAQIAGRQQVLDVLIGCCQCLNKMIVVRSDSLNLQEIVERAVPVSLLVFGKVDNPEVLWPMVNLVANVISKVQFHSDMLVRSIQGGNLSLLIQNDSELLVQALCQMLKGFLCVLPRQLPAKPVYQLVCAFLNNHLSKFHQMSHQKIFYLWYIAIRQYSPIHNCDSLYVELFYSHFRKNLFRKTNTLLYILEQYLLSGLIPSQLQQFVDIIIQCYIQAGQLEKDQCDKLKIAALSFQITLISKYNLEQVNSDQMLKLILGDFCNFDQNAVSSTLRNSLLSILNRYLIKFSTPFFSYLDTIQLPFPTFLQSYLHNMDHLTSHTAIKINAIALLSILNAVDSKLLLPHLPFIIKVTLPEIQHYNKLVQTGAFKPMTGVVDNSPNLRFGTSVLSQRKQLIRKQDYFENVNLHDLFRREISRFLQNVGSSPQELASALEGDLGQRLLILL